MVEHTIDISVWLRKELSAPRSGSTAATATASATGTRAVKKNAVRMRERSASLMEIDVPIDR